MWPKRQPEKVRIAAILQHHAIAVCPLPGIADPRALETLAMQFVASHRREDYFRLIQRRRVSGQRADPHHPAFDPERGVVHHLQHGNVDEAAWLVFLMTHFAKPAETGWRRLRDVYGALGGEAWSWAKVSRHPEAFGAWLDANWTNIGGKFGNHRKYESLRSDANRGTARVVASYIRWIGDEGHRAFFADAIRNTGNDPHTIFDALYRGMSVASFGRLAKFDYLAMLGRYGIAPISAGSAYLDGATGPLKGARLLFDGRREGPITKRDLQRHLDRLDANLAVGMHVIEDGLCNWQKSPLAFVHFRG